MSQSIRQNNLFASEDWRTIYQSFQDVDFRAYDFDTLRAALIDYLRTHFPEDFNDYIESSEFIAVIELLAYLGTSLNFRTDLNSRENFLDTAERRESIVRLARMLSYIPKRNLAASGLFKLSGVQTNESVQDSLGRDLNGRTIFWNDPNNPDSFEQFTTILNAAFQSRNPFGRPTKSGTIGNIPTDLYQLNNVENVAIAYNLSVNVRGEVIPFDVVNPDFNDREFLFERQPDPNEKFHLIFRNDGEGLSSSNTGFFLLFKQGELQRQDFRFDFPIRNRTTDININNINETDVYFQEINQEGTVLNEWSKVPSLVGNNVIFNSIDNQIRNIFSVIPRLNDQITLKFADGNFGNVPVGIYRAWYRTSINKKIAIRPEDVQNLEISIPYFGADGQEYNLRLLFSLEQTVANGSASESNEEIKQRAPQVFYTQNRMVNGEDYNVFPLTRGNEIQRLKALNRTHAGHSRYIDINDPTGTSQNLLVFGDDGALYQDDEQNRLEVDANLDAATITNVNLQNFIDSPTLLNFFYSDYRTNYLALNGSNAFDITNYVDFGSTQVYWEAQPKTGVNDTGFFKDSLTGTINAVDLENTFLTEGAQIRFNDTLISPTEEQWVVAQSIIDNGIPDDPNATGDIGPVELTDQIIDEWIAIDLIPNFRTTFSSAEASAIESRIAAQADFGIGYDVAANNKSGGWFITPGSPTGEETFTTNTAAVGSWLIFCSFDPVDNVWIFTTRGKRYIFESLQDVRFFFDPQELATNVQTGRSLLDEIEILGTNTATSVPADGPLITPIKLSLSELFVYEDGYTDPRKVTVTGVDSNSDGVPDDPLAIDTYLTNGIRPLEDIYFERFTDFDDYEYFRLWIHGRYELGGSSLTITASGTNWELSGGSGTELITSVDLITTTLDPTIDANFKDVIEIEGENAVVAFAGTVIYNTNTDTFYEVEQVTNNTVRVVETQNYIHRIGRTFQLNENNTENPLYFKWTHFAPRANRIDPSVSNIIDMHLLTTTYYNDIITWKNSNDTTAPVPEPPTTEDLRIQFSELQDFKMLSDQIIYKPGKFKLLFGVGAEDELRATFKVVKVPSTTATDNEVRSQIINAIDQYFDIANWDFGERFFYTELSAFIHQQLANIVASVVIVPSKADSAFGDLFQVKAEPDELFLSTASVADVQIVRNLTDTNLRIRN